MIWTFLFGCQLLRSPNKVETDIREHLPERYAEAFTIHAVRGQAMSGGSVPNAYNYEASPVSDPTLQFSGMADYRNGKVTDGYACAQVKR